MVRAVACLSICFLGAVYGQTAAIQRFEVASIKPVPAGAPEGHSGTHSGKGRLTMNNVSLKQCVMVAYTVGPNQVEGGTEWFDSEHFEIAAKAEEPVEDFAVFRAMLQALLAERFKLAIRRETKPRQVYGLEVAKGGPKLEQAEDGNSVTSTGRGLIDAKATGMPRLAELLSRMADAPVINQTGLDAKFNFKLQWNPEADKPLKAGENSVPVDRGVPLATAIQGLGLRLRPQKAPVEVLVIEHAERPTEN